MISSGESQQSLMCGNRDFINEVIDLKIGEVHDSRISNLKVVKEY